MDVRTHTLSLVKSTLGGNCGIVRSLAHLVSDPNAGIARSIDPFRRGLIVYGLLSVCFLFASIKFLPYNVSA